MSRWQPDARERLERAAVELFVEQGFAETTVPQIATRAGLTTRTYFRHFADKREVLFGSDDELAPMIAGLMADAAPELGPFDAIAQALNTVAGRLQPQYDFMIVRHRVVQGDDGLRERELRKRAALTAEIASGFRQRGEDELTSLVAAHLATSVMGLSIERWLTWPGMSSLPDHVREALTAARGMLG